MFNENLIIISRTLQTIPKNSQKQAR